MPAEGAQTSPSVAVVDPVRRGVLLVLQAAVALAVAPALLQGVPPEWEDSGLENVSPTSAGRPKVPATPVKKGPLGLASSGSGNSPQQGSQHSARQSNLGSPRRTARDRVSFTSSAITLLYPHPMFHAVSFAWQLGR
jgi:hypothetical protein